MKFFEHLKSWSPIWWLVTIFGIPLLIPWTFYQVFYAMTRKSKKNALNDKVVMITGASSGLGEALAHIFYSYGCRVILVARRNEELERVKKALMYTHHTVPTHPPVVLPLDLTEINTLPSEMEKVLKIHGRIDILVNNAGMSYRGEAQTTLIDVDIKIMLLNYFAQIALAKAILPSMIKRHSGHVVCISSVQGKIAIPYRSAYAASKHALQAWCDAVRAELFDTNIKVTVFNPGYIKTDLSINAVTGNGEKYGKMDRTTEQGYSREHVAEQLLNAIVDEDKETLVAPLTARVAIFLRYMIPSLYFKIMERRARTLMNQSTCEE